jgi:hypothetical protein
MDGKETVAAILSCILNNGGAGGDNGFNTIVQIAIADAERLTGGELTDLLDEVLAYWYPIPADFTQNQPALVACIEGALGLAAGTLPVISQQSTLGSIVYGG